MFFLPWLLNGDGIIFLLFGIALVAVGAFGALIMLVNAITDFFLQLSLNKRAVTRIALVVLIASVTSCIIVAA